MESRALEKKSKSIRLHVYLARSGIGSRRKCEEYISAGKVRVNNCVVREQGIKVTPRDRIFFEGKEVFPERKKLYIILNKPVRTICAASDPQGRPLAGSEIYKQFSQRLFHVGRLDSMTSGLIFYTNDGEFANCITHPSVVIEKEYRVQTVGPVTNALFTPFLDGIRVEGVKYTIDHFSLESPRTVSIVIHEGKNREVRKIFQYLKVPIRRLSRIRIGKIRAPELAPGEFRELTQKEVKGFLTKSKKGNNTLSRRN